MGLTEKERNMDEIASKFQMEGEVAEIIPFGSGHINDTFRITCSLEGGGSKKYILQKISTKFCTQIKKKYEK